jgi:hypothetical protein
MVSSSTTSTSSTSSRMIDSAVAPTSFTAMPSAIVSPPHSTGRPARRWCIDGVVPRFHAEDADRGLERLRRGRDARDQAAAAHRHHDQVEVGHRGEHLQPDGALSGDDQRVLVRMHEHEVAARGELARVSSGLEQVLALEHHGRTVHLRVLDLGIGRARGMTMVAGMPSRAAW